MNVSAVVVDLLDRRAISVRLSNGHEMVGVVPAKRSETGFGVRIGQTVNILVTPFDMSKGPVSLE